MLTDQLSIAAGVWHSLRPSCVYSTRSSTILIKRTALHASRLFTACTFKLVPSVPGTPDPCIRMKKPHGAPSYVFNTSVIEPPRLRAHGYPHLTATPPESTLSASVHPPHLHISYAAHPPCITDPPDQTLHCIWARESFPPGPGGEVRGNPGLELTC